MANIYDIKRAVQLNDLELSIQSDILSKIKTAFTESDKTLEDISRATNMSEASIADIISGKLECNFKDLGKLLNAFDIVVTVAEIQPK